MSQEGSPGSVGTSHGPTCKGSSSCRHNSFAVLEETDDENMRSLIDAEEESSEGETSEDSEGPGLSIVLRTGQMGPAVDETIW